MCLRAQEASLAGVVVNVITGEPLGGVHVTLRGQTEQVYGALSGRDGRFSIRGVLPGMYSLAPQLRGFVYARTKVEGAVLRDITLKPGQQIADFRLPMMPSAVIVGRVVNEEGDPVEHVEVIPSPRLQQTMLGYGMWPTNTLSDDRGGFRITVPPGKYYVQATPETPALAGSDKPELRTDGTSQDEYTLTYYPSTSLASRAQLLEAAPGAALTGIEIRLVRRRRLSISGMVTGIPDAAAATTIVLDPYEKASQRMDPLRRPVGPDGGFAFSNLPSGDYRLYARYSSGPAQLQSQILWLGLDESDVTNQVLALKPGEELTGTLVIVGEPVGGTAVQGRRVRLEPEALFSGLLQTMTSVAVDQDGKFRIDGVLPGRYRVQVTPLSENDFIKTVRLDGAPALDGMLDLSRGAQGSRAEITVSRNGGQVSGRLLDKTGEPLVNRIPFVFLMPDQRAFGPEQMIQAPDGKYSIRGITPGRYRLFALEIWDGSGQSLFEIASTVEKIEIKEGDRIAKDLRVLDTENADAEQKR